MKKTLFIILIFVFTQKVFAKGLLIEDTESGTAIYPPVLEQVRTRLIQENFAYSYFEGDLTVLRRINYKSLCVEFSNDYAHVEMKKRIESGLVSTDGSSYPSAINVKVVESCLAL